MSTFESQVGMTRGAPARLPHAASAAATHEAALKGRAPLRWRVLLAAALLSLALGVGLDETLARGRSSVLTGARPDGLSRSHGFSREGLLSLPPAAQWPVSATLGAESAAYRVSATAGGLTAMTPAQRLSSRFSRSGVSVASGQTRLGLSLRAIGYGSTLVAVGAVVPSAHGNRVVYGHRGLSESYANGPLGLEQSFTIARAPLERTDGPLTLSIALTGNARASLAKGARSVTFSRAGRTVLRYAGLSVTDARGHPLHSWLQLEGGRMLLRVDASSARYPLRIDPFLQQGSKLTGGEEEGNGELGYSVALSSEGNTALIGGPDDNGEVGAAWVFTRSGSTWTQQGGKLTGGKESGKGDFGWSVALSSDGSTALIGGLYDNTEVGAAWVFTRSGSTWTQQGGKLAGSGETGEGLFGSSVALSADGNTALIGGTGDNGFSGAAWVFTRSGSTWSQQGSKLTGSGAISKDGDFGSSVALSSEGNTALIGRPGDNSEVGAAWVFTRAAGKWTQQGGKLTGKGEIGGGFFGSSVALSSEGTTALIGGSEDNSDLGAAWVFTRSGETWTQQGGKLTGSGEFPLTGEFGWSVALSSEGNIALIGGPFDESGVGAAWVFTRLGSTWTQQGGKLTGSGESGAGVAGLSVALSADGSTAMIGGPFDNNNVGSVWVFAGPPSVETGAALEVTPETAVLNATVNPKGAELSGCRFEYGTTESYGSHAECSSLPGAASEPVAVKAALTELAANTTYHFRISASNEAGTSFGADETFTTLQTSDTGSTESENEPAKAMDGELSAKASDGKGTVTVGDYGTDIGGGPLSKSSEKYVDVHRGTTSSFASVEFKDCELNGGKSIWWYDPTSGWEPVLAPTAVYSEGPPACVTVTITESSAPDLAQLTGTRFGTRFGEEPEALQFGRCEATKDGYYREGNCQAPDIVKGKPKGKFEWYANTPECFTMKHGRYSEAKCETRDENSKGKPTGKYEKGSGAFTATGGPAKFAMAVGTLECQASSSKGEVIAPTTPGEKIASKKASETVTYIGCKLGQEDCSSPGQAPETISTYPLEIFIEDEPQNMEATYVEIFRDPIMSFICAGEEYTLKGGALARTTGDINVMSTTSESVFSAQTGEQELETVTDGHEYKTTLTSTQRATSTQAIEIDTHP